MSNILKICKIHGELINKNDILTRKDTKSYRCKLCTYNRIKIRLEKRTKIIKAAKEEDIVLICKKHGHLTIHSLTKTTKLCRLCDTHKHIKWQKKNPKKIKEYQKKTRSNPDFALRNRKGFIRRKYGITIEDYENLLKKQNGVCAICKKEDLTIEANSLRLKGLCIDHCHKTGKIRGLLCNRCNPMIGYSQDSIDNLLSAVEYLKAHQ